MPSDYVNVGFTGAGGTGKTELAKRVAEYLGVPFLGSPVRKVTAELTAEMKEPIAQNLTPQEQWDVQRHIFIAKFDQDLRCQGRVTDRILLDAYSYSSLFCWREIVDPVVEAFEKLVVENYATYKAVFYAPVESFLSQQDSFRLTGLAYAHTLDAVLRGHAARLGLKLIILPPGSVEVRYKFVLDLLEHGR